MADTSLIKALTTKTGEKHADDPEDLKMPDYPGMIPIKGKKNKIATALFVVFTIIFLMLNLTMFIVGVTSTQKCPIQPNIPVYLLVAGILGIVTKALVTIYLWKDGILVLRHISHALLFTELIWGILGSYWVYSVYEPNFIETPKTPYCDRNVYFLAFWLLNIHYIFGILFFIVACGILCRALFCGISPTVKEERN